MKALLAVGAAMAAHLIVAAAAEAAPGAIFDPTADPAFELARARKAARAENKNLLLDIGGNWCVWCKILDGALHREPVLKRLVDRNYVLVHVNVSPENLNRSFMSRFPTATGYPFLIVLTPNGKTLHAQNGLEFQKGKSPQDGYDPASVARFLERWKPDNPR